MSKIREIFFMTLLLSWSTIAMDYGDFLALNPDGEPIYSLGWFMDETATQSYQDTNFEDLEQGDAQRKPSSQLKINFRKRPLEAPGEDPPAKQAKTQTVVKPPPSEEADEEDVAEEEVTAQSQEPSIPCAWDDCEELFVGEKSLDDHVNSEHIKGGSKHVCRWRLDNDEICGKVVKDRTRLSHHAVSHTKYKAFTCSMAGCGKSFGLLHQFNTHLDSHREKAKYICPRGGCGRIFDNKIYRDNHLAMHDERVKYVCQEPGCTGEYKRKRNLDSHVQSVHRNLRPFVCHFTGCEGQFYSSSDLAKHERIHTDERPYPCSVSGCKQRFVQKEHMIGHLKTHGAHKAPRKY